MWIYGVSELPVTADDIYWHSTKPTQPEDLFRISTEADQGRIIAYIQLSSELLRVTGQRVYILINKRE
jgi:hypothetical protein